MNEDATYLHDRSLDALVQVGGLTGVRRDVAFRADGIIDALPADGRLDVEELVRLEESPYADLLFEEEQMALPSLWPLLEVPDAAPQTLSFDELAPFEVEDRTVEPSGLEFPSSIVIDEFAPATRPTLSRLQLAFDEDGDDQTVSRSDLDAALAQPGAFTPDEISRVQAAADWYYAQGTSSLSAVLAVPTPGVSTESVGAGALSLARTISISVTEQRDWRRYRNRRRYDRVPPRSQHIQIELSRTIDVGPVLGLDERLLLISTVDENDQVVDEQAGAIDAGVYLAEHWVDGERVAVMWAELPSLGQSSETQALDERTGHRFETFDGVPLQYNLRSAMSLGPDGAYSDLHYLDRAVATWDLGPELPTGEIDERVVRDSEVRRSALPPGRYAFVDDWGTEAWLDIFPEGALRVTESGMSSWMAPSGEKYTDPRNARRFEANVGSSRFQFEASRERLRTMRAGGHSDSTTLSPAERTD